MCFAPQRRNFSSLIWPAGSAPAALASLLFDPPEPQIIGKTQFRDFPTFSILFAHLHLLSSDLSPLSASSLLCFSSLHIVGSLTSKLPSIIVFHPCFMRQLATADEIGRLQSTALGLHAAGGGGESSNPGGPDQPPRSSPKRRRNPQTCKGLWPPKLPCLAQRIRKSWHGKPGSKNPRSCF